MKTRSKAKPSQPTPSTECPDLMIRAATVDVRAADGDKPAQVRMSVSSEEPVLTYIYFNEKWQRAFEILDHSPGSVDMSRCKDGLVILDRHYGDQIGLMAVELDNRKMGGPVAFCTGTRAQEIEKDAAKGLRRNVSVGYQVRADSYRLEGDKDGIPVVRAMSWMPYEASFEPVPADTTVGVNRAAKTEAADNPPVNTRSTKMSEKQEVKLDAEAVVEIYRLARAFGMEPGQADEHIKSGKSVEDFRALALKKAETDKAEMERKLADAQKTRKPDRPAIDPTDKGAQITDARENAEIARRYSVMNVVRYLDAVSSGRKPDVDIGFELEISKELGKRADKPAQGVYIPHSATVAFASKRADPFLYGSNGSNFVATNLLVGQFIDALRTKMVLDKAGVVTLGGLQGNIAIPKGGTITGGWVDGENNAVTDAKPTTAQVTGEPHTASGWTDISRRLLLQSSIDVEMMVQNELVNTIARLIEVAAFAGTNANGQPKGLTGVSGLNTPALTVNAPTRAQLLAMIENIMTDNADFEGMSWMMRPTGWALLANTIETRGVNANGETVPPGATAVGGSLMPEYVLDIKTKTMLGFPYHVSMNVPNHALFFGAWSQMIIGLWSGVDLIINPYTNSTTGALRIVALQDADIMVRHGQAFSYEDALTS